MIVVCGEALIDVVQRPDGSEQKTPGGGPFNTARALSRLGVPKAFLGRLSTDPFGRQLARLLSADGVDLSLASTGPEPTTVARASISKEGSATYRFITDGTSAPNLTPGMLPPSLDSGVSAIHVGTLGLVLEPIASTIIELLNREGARRLIMVDPNIRPEAIRDAPAARARIRSVIAQSTIVKAGEDDLAWLYPDRDTMTAAAQMLAAGPRLVVVTLGAQGAVGLTAAARVRVPAPVVDVIDTIGAGDTFGAALLAWLHERGAVRRELLLDADELKAALTFACRAASLTCARFGADPPSRAEVYSPSTDDQAFPRRPA